MICPQCSNMLTGTAGIKKCVKCGNEIKPEIAAARERIDHLQKLVDLQVQWLMKARRTCQILQIAASRLKRSLERRLMEKEMTYASEQGILNAQWNVALAAQIVEEQRARPFFLLRPQMVRDGNQWCALYGSNLHDGVAGFGDTPELAAEAFDRAWRTERSNAQADAPPLGGRGLAQS